MSDRPNGRAEWAGTRAISGITLALTFAWLTLAKSELVPAFYLVVVTLASAAAWLGVRRSPRGHRLVPTLVALGATAWIFAELTWFALNPSGSDAEASVADLPFLSAYGMLVIALALVIVRGQTDPLRPQRGGAGVDAMVDVLTTITVCLLVVWNISIDSIAADDTYTLPSRVVLTAYPILDVVTLALVARAVVDRRTRSQFVVCVGATVLCWLGDDLSSLAGNDDRILMAVQAGVGMLAAGFLALATHSQVPAAGLSAPDLTTPRAMAGRLAMANLPLMVPTVLLATDLVSDTGIDLWSGLLAFAVLIVLSVIRTGRLLLDQRDTLIELSEARDTAIQASRAKSRFVATMSHEIRTPIGGVIGLTDLLLTTDLTQRQRQYATGVRGAGDQLLAVVNNILDFSKAEAGKVEIEQIDFDVAEVIDRACALAADSAARKGVELIASCGSDVPPTLRGDPTRLTQALLNLVANAVKFTDDGEVVASVQLVEATEDGVVVRVEVRDTGIGISKEDRGRLFQPFEQASSSTTRRFGGTGLGLPITRHLVVAMGGDIGVTSQVGHGSTFWFTVPLSLPAGDSVAQAALHPNLHQVRVLVADDNATSGAVRREQLERWGLRVDLVADVDLAVSRLREANRTRDPYRVVLTNAHLVGSGGVDLVRLIESDPTLDPAVIMLATRTEIADLEEATAGVEVTLMKPVPSAVLLDAVRSACQRDRGTELDETPDAQEPANSEESRRVLIVDDAEVNQIIARAHVERLGFIADSAEDGERALHELAQRRYDVVLMDCQMPVLDGFEATRRLRTIESAGRRTPVVALTASAAEDERERCLAAGMDDYLTKPIEAAAVARVLDRWAPAHPGGRESR
jgi:two-component system, sensor histidine kinase and response regulator